MAIFKLSAGAEIDLLTKDEVDSALRDAEERELVALAGIKPFRFQMFASVASSAVTIGDPSTGNVGGVLTAPEQGFVWVVKHLVVEGLTSGATPDVVNIYRSGRIIWQLNGNQFAQTWGSGQIILNPGESLYVKSTGTVAATGQITVHGTIWEVPAQLVGKLF